MICFLFLILKKTKENITKGKREVSNEVNLNEFKDIRPKYLSMRTIPKYMQSSFRHGNTKGAPSINVIFKPFKIHFSRVESMDQFKCDLPYFIR